MGGTIEEKVLIEIVTKLKARAFQQFQALMHQTERQVVGNVNRINKVFNTLFKTVTPQQAQFQQSMDGFKTKINSIKESLKPMSKELKQSMEDGFVQPSKTAEQAAEGIINKQRELSQQSKIMKKNLEETGIKRLRDQSDSLFGVFRMGLPQWRQVNTQAGGFKTRMGRLANKARLATHGLRGFKMELLGVMFFGMGIQKFFTGLLRPAAEMVGLFEIWGVILKVLFLPIMIKILPKMLNFLDTILNLTDEQKENIGMWALFGAALGTALFLIGMMGLGIGSLIQAFGWLFSAGGVVFAGIALMVWGLYKVFKGDFEGIGLIIMGVGLILLLFIGWWALIPIAVGAAVYLIIKHWSGIKHFFSQLWISIKIIFIEAIMGLIKFMYKSPLFGRLMEWLSPQEEVIKSLTSMKDLLESEFDLSNMVYETEKKNKEAKEKMDGGMKGIIASLKEGMGGMNKEIDDGMGEMTYTTEDTMKTMEGLQTDSFEVRLKETKVFVGDMNSELGKIGSDAAGSFGNLSSAPKAVYDPQSKTYKAPSEIGNMQGGTNLPTIRTGYGDFLFRPGQRPISFSPNDTIMGFKGGMGGGGVSITQNNVINSTIKDDIERMINDNNSKLVDEINRLTQATSGG